MDIDKLEKLSELKDKGILTQEEFNEQKKKILFGQNETTKSKKDKSQSNKDFSDTDKDRNIWNNYFSCLKKYFQFSGRATRYEYWGFVFINTLVSIVLSLIDILGETDGILNGLFALVIFIPTISVFVRRLHDVNKSAWILLIPFLYLIPLAVIGAVINYSFGENEQILKIKTILYILCGFSIPLYFIYLICKKSYADKNKYGENSTEEKFERIGKRLIIGTILLSILSALSILFYELSTSIVINDLSDVENLTNIQLQKIANELCGKSVCERNEINYTYFCDNIFCSLENVNNGDVSMDHETFNAIIDRISK